MKYIVKKIGNMSVKVIINEDMSSCEGSISSSDAEMDKRAAAAVRSAIYRAKVCKKPVARYDVATKRAFFMVKYKHNFRDCTWCRYYSRCMLCKKQN